MKTKYTTINAAISDWLEDNKIGMEEIDESLLKKWVLDCLKEIKREDQYVHKLALVDVSKYKAELPADFHRVCQVAYRYEKPKKKCGRHEQITQWVQGTLEKDCQLEINLICDRCHKTKCDCSTTALEVDIDSIWEDAHPELYYNHFNKIGRWGYGNSPESYYTPDFKLMRYNSSDWFQTGKFFIPECANVNCERCEETFTIEHPYIETSFSKGEILLSYLGQKVDEEGNPFVPDITPVHEAITWWIEHKWWWREYRTSNNNHDLRRSELAADKRDKAIGRAINRLSLPDYHNLYQILDQNWLKRSNRKGEYGNYYKYMSFRGDSNISQGRHYPSRHPHKGY